MPPKQVITNIRPLNKARNFLRLTPSIFHHRQKHTTYISIAGSKASDYFSCLFKSHMAFPFSHECKSGNKLNKYFKSFDSRTLSVTTKKERM